MHLIEECSKKPSPREMSMDELFLWNKISVEQAEADHMVFDKRLGNEGIPFGFQNDRWKKLLAQMIDSDEIWEFTTPEESWRAHWGRAGTALVRDGIVIMTILSRLS